MNFTGTFPHYRRPGKEHIDLITFQFDKRGGGFVIEISKCPPDGITTTWGQQIPANKIRAWDVHPDKRLRLQPRPGSSPDDWFRYDNFTVSRNLYYKTAREVLPFLDIAENWWAE